MQRDSKRNWITWTMLALLVGTACLPSPARVAAAAGNGKKAFQAGQKLEAEGKLDEAAEMYLLAAAQESNKPEYTIALRRTSSSASVMLVRKGRELMEQGNFEEAYNAFRRAYQFDPTNDLSKDLARRALDRQRQIEGITTVPIKARPYGGGDPGQEGQVRPPAPSEGPAGEEKGKKDTAGVISYRDKLRAVITSLTRQLDLNVAFDNSFQDKDLSIELRNVTKAQALDIILQTNGLFFTTAGDNTIIVALDNLQNRNKLQDLSIQTFYLRNADPQQVVSQIAILFSNKVFASPFPDLRAVSMRGTPQSLKLAEQVVSALDKNKPEVLIDVSIYEVSRSDTVEIGNQLLFDGFLGQGSSSVPAPSTLNFLGVTAGQILTSQRFALAIPTSVIRLLQNRGTSRLVDSLQVHALDGQQVTANVGQRVPIQTASLPFGLSGTTTPGTGTGTPGTGTGSAATGLYGGIPQIEYQPVGLNVQITPTIYTDDDVKLEMQIESSSLAASSVASLTPTITTRTLKSFATVKTGQAAMMAGVAQKRAGQSRAGLPVLGFMPVIGRFFSVPKNTNDTTDLIITVTPHIVRAADISDHDRLAKLAGTQMSGGPGTTIELFLEERDARNGTPAPPVTTTTTTTTARVLPSPIPESSARTDAFSKLISAILPAAPVGPAGATLVSTSVPVGSPPDHRIQVLLHADVAQPRAGGSMQLEVMAQGESGLSESLLALDFDPKVLRVREVSDGGMLETPGTPAQISAWRDPEGRLLIHVKPGRGGAAAGTSRGRLAVVHFDVVSPGSAAIRFDDASSRLMLADGRTALCASTPLIIEAR
ncbi:MAG: hypothetical protein HY650_05355 [Acidobacteria bacterium]|nr:hypothetical protein [Acidobacteriota bacterium]